MPTISPFDQAIDRILGKTPLASRLRTKHWAQVPLAIRERALFSAAVDDVRILDRIYQKLGEMAQFDKRADNIAFMDRSKFRTEMKEFLQSIGLETGGTDLTKIGSDRRLNLVYDFASEDAMSYGRWKNDQDPDLLALWPCQELIRIENRRMPRKWRERWAKAGGRLYQGRMIARKDDPVWTKISRFGRPWPPYDFGSGMGIEDVDRDEAESLGVIEPDDEISPIDEDFNKSMEASMTNVDPVLRKALKRFLGDHVIEEGENLKMKEAR